MAMGKRKRERQPAMWRQLMHPFRRTGPRRQTKRQRSVGPWRSSDARRVMKLRRHDINAGRVDAIVRSTSLWTQPAYKATLSGASSRVFERNSDANPANSTLRAEL